MFPIAPQYDEQILKLAAALDVPGGADRGAIEQTREAAESGKTHSLEGGPDRTLSRSQRL